VYGSGITRSASRRINAPGTRIGARLYAAHEEQHRKNFWNAAAKNRFCSVNTTAVLIDPDWLSFFAQLERGMGSDSNQYFF
jgi:hypothetical protein